MQEIKAIDLWFNDLKLQWYLLILVLIQVHEQFVQPAAVLPVYSGHSVPGLQPPRHSFPLRTQGHVYKAMLQIYADTLPVQAAHLSFLFPILESTCHFSLSASIFMIMTITIERWQAVCFPFSYQVTCTICTLIFFLAFYFIKQK